MAEQVGEISYVVKVDTSGMVTGIKQANNEIGDLGKESDVSTSKISKLCTALKVIGVGLVIKKVATGIADIGKQAIFAYAETEQLRGGIDTLFKDSSEIVQKNASEAFRKAGISANTYMEQATAFASRLMQDTGNNTKRTAELVDIAIRDMADNSAKLGTSIDSIQNAYQGLAKGNATMLDNLKVGYGGTQTEMLRLVKDMGIVEDSVKSFNDISFEQSIMAIHQLQEQLEIADVAEVEAYSTISGSINMLQNAWTNFLAGIADPKADFDALTDGIVDAFMAVSKNIEPALDTIAEHIPKIAEAISTKLPLILDALKPVIVATIEAVAEFIKVALPEIVPIILPLAFDLLGTIFVALLGPVADFLDDVFYKIGAFFEQISIALSRKIWEMVAQMVNFGLKVREVFMNIKDTIFGVWEKIKNGVKDIALKLGEAVGGALKGAINKVLGFVEGVINTPINAINGLINVINAVPGVNLGKLNKVSLPRLASGGIVESNAGGSVIMAGEAGEDEWVVPESKMASMIEQLEARGIGGRNITINVEGIWATNESQKRVVAEDIWSKINEINRSRMGAYL